MRAGVALGSNIGDRLQHLRSARSAISRLAEKPVLMSPVYETDPIGCEPGAQRFWNAVMEIGFTGEAIALFHQLQAIEQSLGRPAARPKNVSRQIDLDLLYFGESEINSAALQLPHPRMFTRQFVLQPLADIRPDLRLPGQENTVRQLLARTRGSARVVALPEQWA